MAQATNYPYCNIIDDLQLAFKDIEDFRGLDTLESWTQTSGQTNTYEIKNTGYYDAVYEDGAALTEKTSIATVEATASTFWYDSTNDILYAHTSDSADPDTHTMTAAVDDWVSLKTKMRNRGMEMMEGMLDRKFPRPIPFAPTNRAYDGNKYDFDITNSCAKLTCYLIIKHRDPTNPLAEKLLKEVWNPQEESGTLWGYYQGKRAFSFEATKDQFLGNFEAITYDSSSTGRIYITGQPDSAEFLRWKYRVKISTAGAPETAKYTFSQDGGLTYSSDENDTYERFTHLVNNVYIRFEGTFVQNDEWEIIFADPREKVNSIIGSFDVDTSGYEAVEPR